MKMNTLKPIVGKSRRRIGRGTGSGRGKTATYGHKGAKARSGGSRRYFEGGQMPIYRRLPKRGFVSMFNKKLIDFVNVCDIQKFITNKKIDAKSAITIDILKNLGLVKRSAKTIKLLGKGEIKEAINISIHYATKSALEAISKCGGSVEIVKNG